MDFQQQPIQVADAVAALKAKVDALKPQITMSLYALRQALTRVKTASREVNVDAQVDASFLISNNNPFQTSFRIFLHFQPFHRLRLFTRVLLNYNCMGGDISSSEQFIFDRSFLKNTGLLIILLANTSPPNK